jgi:hypothetical protein
MSRSKFVCFVLLLCAPAIALAQGDPDSSYASPRNFRGMFELTPTVSYNFGGTINGEDSVLSDFDLEAENGEAYGITFGIPVSKWAQIELLASRQRTDLRFDDGLFGGTTPGFADFDVSYYHVGGLFQWGSGQIHPFVVLSLGVATLDPNVSGSRAETRFSGSVGGGVKIFFTDNVGLRLEGRGFWTMLDDSDDYYYDDDCYCDYGYTNTFDQGQASAGLIIAW